MTDEITLHNADSVDVTDLWDDLEDRTSEFSSISRKDRQLNLRVDEALLAAIREVATVRGEGYHTYARRLIEEGVARELAQASDPRLPSDRPFRMKEVILVLLGATDPDAANEAMLVGRTRLQKMLFLAAQHLKPQVAARFEAYSYGPFDESVESDVEFLASEGLVEASGYESITQLPEDDADRGRLVLDWIRTRNEAAASSQDEIETYRLTRAGMEWVRRFLASEEFGTSDAKQQLWAECIKLKATFGRVPQRELVDYVYANFPEFTKNSKIRDQVAARIEQKSRS